MKKYICPMMIVLLFWVSQTVFAADTYKIGVLAKRGPVKALKMWKSTGTYLTEKVPGTFEVVPLDFDAVFPAVEKGEVDFFLVNSSMFITAKVKYGAKAVATMINSRQGNPLKSFGGVILTSEENDEINSINDLKGKTFAAVKKSSFGGWQMAYMELLNQGIDPFKDFSKLDFAGKHDNVVLAVQNGASDAGTVRTDTLERMASEGIIDMEEFKILNPQSHSGFPFVCSTALYPEWPMAKTKGTPDAVVQQVVSALKLIKAGDQAAKDAKIVGWTDALDYQGVEDLQIKLKVGAYQ
ncbi:phosphate/phosphite/phosphonate ABC transporter substrate-binding protein [Desulfospira joergensenii]|uniref:phosphate/phosphite/phosphonate ABC transporter substrate-binding protein n=1 Tax=Desulfospira joergensenii TaxID=53329 RepID=UPI0003B70788|nr:PhnD/SsuA/transferrin family substrate-binding protein [Desulfospira joergensenii]